MDILVCRSDLVKLYKDINEKVEVKSVGQVRWLIYLGEKSSVVHGKPRTRRKNCGKGDG